MNYTITAEHLGLVAYLTKYCSKERLAEMLADAAFGRPLLVPSPEQVAITRSESPRRGRMSQEEIGKKCAGVWLILEEVFPQPVTVEDLALAVSLTPKTLERVQAGYYPLVLESCPTFYRAYFASLPTRSKPVTSRLTGSWRAALDFHSYHLAVQHGIAHDLFTCHAMFWGQKGIVRAEQAGRLDSLNLYEAQRVKRLAELIQQHREAQAWPVPDPAPPDLIVSHQVSECAPLLHYRDARLLITLHDFIIASGTPKEWWDMTKSGEIALPSTTAHKINDWAIHFLVEVRP